MTQQVQSAITEQSAETVTTPSPAMRLYATIWWLSFAIFTTIMFFAVVLALPTVLFDPRRRVLHVLTTCFWGWAVYAMNPFWSLRVEGREKVPWDGRAVLVANHDSLADILVVGSIFRPFKFVSKASVFKVPLMGWGMRANQYIPLVRGNGESVRRMMADCRSWLERDVPVLLFPEGTRSPDGLVQPFKNGAFQLSVETGSPIYPIVLAGTADALPKHGLIAPLRSHVRVKVLDPVDPAEFGNNAEALREHVRTVIVSEKAKLLKTLPPTTR